MILFFFIDSNISTNAYSLMNGSCVNGGSGGTIIIRAKNVCFFKSRIICVCKQSRY